MFMQKNPKKKLREKLKKKKPTFRGRFGKRKVRRPKSKKWDKWRKPRGIDIHRYKEDGRWPKIGYRNPRMIRGLHPSGFEEVLVHNENVLESIDPKVQAIRIGGRVGKRRRMLILEKAEKLGIKVLNP